MKIKLVLLAAAAVGSIATADGQTYRVNYTGTAATPTGIIGGVNPSPVTSTIKSGDRINVVLDFDISKASVTSLFDADPTINIYSIPMTYSYTAGGYSSGPVSVSGGYLQIWNNYNVSAYNDHVDNYSFGSLDRYIENSTSPVNLGAGRIFAGLSLYAFDNTGTKLNSDLITALPNYDGWSTSMELSFLNVDTNDFALVRANNVAATITQIDASAVPEPATWAMMILGMGAVGYATRRRQKVRVAYA